MEKEYIYLQICESTVVYIFYEYGIYIQYYVKYFEIPLALLWGSTIIITLVEFERNLEL